MINRGKTYWKSNFKSFPKIRHYYGDRHQYFEYQKLLAYISKKHGISPTNKWDLVVDFCAFERKEIKTIIRGLEHLLKLYVFISSDSIYDVCDASLRKMPKIVEEYAIRPQDQKKVKKLNSDDDYGNDKLKCEEYLLSHVQHQFQYVSLRLPDVIGPYDSSGRFWGYQKWVKVCKQFPVHFNKHTEQRKLSLVFSEDVVTLIMQMLAKVVQNDQTFLNRVHTKGFNVSFDQEITLYELLKAIGGEVGVQVHGEMLGLRYILAERIFLIWDIGYYETGTM